MLFWIVAGFVLFVVVVPTVTAFVLARAMGRAEATRERMASDAIFDAITKDLRRDV